MNIRPVVVYGASGYTAQLICEYLRHFEIPFIAAGRNGKKIKEALRYVPGIETADYETVEVSHDVEALAGLFDGAKIICNTVGPFNEFGETVVKAALKANCHYIDTCGEQPFFRKLRDNYDSAFAEKNLTLAPGTASMWGELDILTDICIQAGGIDSIETSMVALGVPTYASTQTIFQMFLNDAFYLSNGELLPWPRSKIYEFSPPSGGILQRLHHWGGSALPVYYEHHPMVRNLRALSGFTAPELMDKVLQMENHYYENLKDLPIKDRLAELSKFATSLQGGMPPRENPLVHRTMTTVVGRGTSREVVACGRGTGGYTTTGALQAAAARLLLTNGPERTGFQSPSKAFGSKYLRDMLERLGLWRVMHYQEWGVR